MCGEKNFMNKHDHDVRDAIEGMDENARLLREHLKLCIQCSAIFVGDGSVEAGELQRRGCPRGMKLEISAIRFFQKCFYAEVLSAMHGFPKSEELL